jgi:formamidopyrimidine-DNA glycosylase
VTRGAAGINPLGDHFTLDAFAALVRRYPDRPARAFLLDADILTSIAPEHADAVLERAQLGPERAVGELSDPELHRLHREIRDVLGSRLEGHHGYES